MLAFKICMLEAIRAAPGQAQLTLLFYPTSGEKSYKNRQISLRNPGLEPL